MTRTLVTVALFALSFAYACEPSRPAVAPQPPPPLRLRLLLPLAEPGAALCDRDCADRYAPGTTTFYECFAACPGADASDEASCGEEDVRPKAACYMVDVIDEPIEESGPASSTPGAIASVLQTSLQVTTRSATGGKPSRPKLRPAATPSPTAPSPRTPATPTVHAPDAVGADSRLRAVARDGGAP